MNYEKVVEESIDYIKSHINEDLSASKIANHVGYSVYHFCRIFSLIKNLTVMEYVRKYRLSMSRSELEGNRRIIDVALKYGFETASGFTKSFHKEFGYTPSSYMVRMKDTDRGFVKNIGEVLQEPEIVQKKAFKVAGYGIYTNVAKHYLEDVAAYWALYEGNNLESRMYEQLQPPRHGEVGICLPYENNEKAVYLFGVVVEDFDQVTSDMMVTEIPEATYAVFTTPPVNNLHTASTYDKDPLAISVKETWRYIFTEWFLKSSYVLDETRYPFEFYDERCHASENAVMEIYVPIKCNNKINYYGSLCTEMYEILHEKAPQDELDFYLSYAKKGKRILEALCGSGRFLIPFMERGYDISGIDLSSEMLDKLKQKAPNANVVQADILEYSSVEKYDYIFISSGSVSLFTDIDLCKKILKKLKEMLAPKGKFVFAVDTVANKCLDDDNLISVKTKEGFDLVLKTKDYYDKKSQTQFSPSIYELYNKDELIQSETMDYQLHLYRFNEMEQYLKEIGFKTVITYCSFQKEIATGNHDQMFLFECSL